MLLERADELMMLDKEYMRRAIGLAKKGESEGRSGDCQGRSDYR